MNKPFFTIAIPVYNRLNYLKEAVNSALNQTFTNFELLIIDDNSTEDNVWDYISSLKDKRIRAIKNKENLGIVPNWIKCIEEANGKWFKFLLSDDILYKNALSFLYELIRNYPDNFVIVTSGKDFKEISELKDYIYNEEIAIKNSQKYVFPIDKIIQQRKRFNQTWANPNAYTLLTSDLKKLIKTEDFKKVASILGKTGHCVDYYILYAIALKYKTMIEVDFPLYGTRCHETNFSKTYNQDLLYHLRGDKFVHYLLYEYKGIENFYIIRHAFRVYFNKLLSNKRAIFTLYFPKKTIQLFIFLFEHIFKINVASKLTR
ncbi:MAG: glycosyltransferase family 2 protein [Actinobacteria bacterium]|nr:glycosyltransferase family 2 protein [Actinomycetota bacterium]